MKKFKDEQWFKNTIEGKHPKSTGRRSSSPPTNKPRLELPSATPFPLLMLPHPFETTDSGRASMPLTVFLLFNPCLGPRVDLATSRCGDDILIWI